MSEDKDKGIGGLVFVACMFIGGGIGLLLGRPDVGGAIGMGVGFLIMALLRTRKIEEKPLEISLPRTFGQVTLIVLGLIIICIGIAILYNPDLLYPYIAGFAAILRGIILLLAGLTGLHKIKSIT